MTTGHVGLDSQCYTYLIDAMASIDEPTDALAEQRIALFRTFLYRDGGLFITPTVRREFAAIRRTERALHHESWTTLFPETQPIDPTGIDSRANALRAHHGDADDCRIVAECEDASLEALITFDDRLIARLRRRTSVALLRPSEYWAHLAIPRGAEPFTVPRGDNPMAVEQWWRWV